MGKLSFLDRSREREHGDIEVDVPDCFETAIRNLIVKLKTRPEVMFVECGNMAAFLHLRTKFSKDTKHEYLLGWNKERKTNNYTRAMERTFYINKHAMHALGLIGTADLDRLVDFLEARALEFTMDGDNLKLKKMDFSKQTAMGANS
jgi:hypothetical protein